MGTLRRNTELGLLILGSVITGGTYTLASLGRTASIPADIGPFLAVVLGLLLAAHVVTRRLAREGDGLLLPIAGLLNGIGYVFIARLNTDLAALQATWTLVGITAYAATLMFVPRIRPLEGYRYTFAAIGMGLLLVPLIPGLGREINGARIWASIGPVNFQPGEFAKIVLALFLAAYLVETRELLAMQTFRLGPFVLPDPRHFAPLVLAWGTSLVVMVLEKDLGSSLLFFTLFLVLVWVATERAAYLVAGGAMFAVGAVTAWSQFAHVQSRVDIWLNPWADPKGAGFQPVEAAFALADGGLAGAGPGLGSPGKIPAAETDFIFAVIGEELGLFGATAILVAFLLMAGSGLRIAVRSEDPFSKLLATGLTTLLGFQAFIIVAGVIRVLPLTGVTLPFVSYGGSSLVANYILLALLVRISDDSSRRARQRREDQERRAVVDELRASRE